MDISDIKIRKTIAEGRLRAIVSITFDDTLAVHDIKIVQEMKDSLLLCRAVKTTTGFSATLFTRFPLKRARA